MQLLRYLLPSFCPESLICGFGCCCITLLLGLAASGPASGQFARRQLPIEFPPDIRNMPISAADVSAGWIALFDGHSLFGWRAESSADWRVENGIIRVDSGEAGLLRTTSQFDDFELRLEFLADRDSASGVFLRTSPRPRGPSVDCYQINIARPQSEFPAGSLVERVKGVADIRDNEFNRLEVSAIRGRIRVRINGELVADYTDPGPLGRGFIGLQFKSGIMQFRNIQLRPLELQPLFDQDESAGWTVVADNDGFECSVNEPGEIWLAGSGYLESEPTFANAVIQLKSRISPGGNSGVFFRCVPGERLNGYESQIDNGYETNREQPLNAGTGAIFRRSTARRIMADDDRWFAKTLVVEGPHVGVWVNGYQVVDWSDQREPHVNPRRGRRLEAGKIQLQGHDDDTHVRFREIWARELAPRR